MVDTMGIKRQGNPYSTSRKETFNHYKEKYQMETNPHCAFSIPTCTAKSPNEASSAACLLSQPHDSLRDRKSLFCLNTVLM